MHFPTAGRPATMIRSESLKPPVMRSRSWNPDGIPMTPCPLSICSEMRASADAFQNAHRLQLRGQRDVVDGLAPGEQVERRAIDLAVVLAVEVLGVQELQHLGYRQRVHEDRPEHGHLRVEVVWRHPP